MKVNRCYKSLAFLVVTSLSFCLFAQIFPADLHADDVGEADECGDALSIALPSVLEGFDRSNIRITDKDKKQLFTKKFSGENIIITEITNELIGHPEFTGPEYDRYTISFLVNGQVKTIGFSIQKTNMYPSMRLHVLELMHVLEKVPRNLLGRVNKIAILFEESESELERYYALFREGILSDKIRMDIVKINETHHSPGIDEIIIRMPPIIPLDRRGESLLYFDIFRKFILHSIVEHQLGHIMAYHRYGEFTPNQEWHNAILADNASISEYGNTNVAEDFAEAMALYLGTDRRLLHPDTEGEYTHRIEILDEMMGLDSSQRRQIEERNREIDHLFKQLGLLNGLDNMFIGHTYYSSSRDKDDIIAHIISDLRAMLLVNSNALIMARTLASKALTLHGNKPLDFISTDESSVRENLIRTLAFNGLFFLPTKEGDKFFITNTIHSLDTLSTSEMKRRLHVFDQVFMNELLVDLNIDTVDRALRFFDRHSFPPELDGEKFGKFFCEIYSYSNDDATAYGTLTLTTIDLQDTLSSSDMESYLHTLKEAANIFVEKYEEYEEKLRGLDIDEDREEIEKIEKEREEYLFFKIVGRILEKSPTGRRIKEALKKVLREHNIKEIP